MMPKGEFSPTASIKWQWQLNFGMLCELQNFITEDPISAKTYNPLCKLFFIFKQCKISYHKLYDSVTKYDRRWDSIANDDILLDSAANDDLV